MKLKTHLCEDDSAQLRNNAQGLIKQEQKTCRSQLFAQGQEMIVKTKSIETERPLELVTIVQRPKESFLST
ncbi:hypothetical protein AWC38_SpisGene14187 [Stylophora pistillata]|uniref:Uncharacterized protein n=1 Tax=Stylophora pistillata TaxID=50429 RepID=A0A2B4RX00_STYPI|nr:hypothetical protein AWC38_SpisGene14187 [Stylophora pistillata]